MPFELVDVGWKGRPATALSSVLTPVGAAQRASLYYLGLLSELPSRVRANRVAYLFAGGRPLGAGAATQSLACFDVLCSGREGQTTASRSATGRSARCCGTPTNRCSSEARRRPRRCLRPTALAVLQALVEDPTREEAVAWATSRTRWTRTRATATCSPTGCRSAEPARSAATGVFHRDWNAGAVRRTACPRPCCSAAPCGSPVRCTGLERGLKR